MECPSTPKTVPSSKDVDEFFGPSETPVRAKRYPPVCSSMCSTTASSLCGSPNCLQTLGSDNWPSPVKRPSGEPWSFVNQKTWWDDALVAPSWPKAAMNEDFFDFQIMCSTASTTPPSTPRCKECPLSPPPAPRPHPTRNGSPLLTALLANSYEELFHALQEDPQAARFPILAENLVGSSLCVAVRLRCDACLVELLLDHGADPNATDSRGVVPLSILCSLPSSNCDFDRVLGDFAEAREEQSCLVARKLLDAGADPVCRGEDGLSAESTATAVGNTHLSDILAEAKVAAARKERLAKARHPWPTTGLATACAHTPLLSQPEKWDFKTSQGTRHFC